MRYYLTTHTLVFGLASALVLPRDDVPQEISDAFGAAGVETKPYERPNQFLRTIFSPGDSFTAGIGSNGEVDWFKDSGHVDDSDPGCSRYSKAYPEALRDHSGWDELQGSGDRRNNFGACSGHTIQGILDNQLKQGPAKDGDKFKGIGEKEDAPQVAILTAGGNDLDFASIIKACIYGIKSGCDSLLKDGEDKLTNGRDDIKASYHKLYANVLAAGRKASQDSEGKGGANPPQSFQIFHATYVPFFNETTDFCNSVTWSYFFTGLSLTNAHRKRLNDLVRSLNDIIREAADEYKSWGVFSVDAHVDKFNGHLFCDEVPGNQPLPGWPDLDYNQIYASHQSIGPWTWFWALRSPWKDHDEGPDNRPWPHDPYDGGDGPADTRNITDNPDSEADIKQAILDRLVPDQNQQAEINGGADPATFNDTFNDDRKFDVAISDITVKSKDGEVEINLNDGWLRVFHPKGSGHAAIRDAFFDAIKDNRDFGKPTKALSIIAESSAGSNDFQWQYFETDYGKAVECRTDPVTTTDATFNEAPKLTYPGGTTPLKLSDKDCEYKNSGDNPGRLFCGDKAIDCKYDPADKNPTEYDNEKGFYQCEDKTRQPVFVCEY